MKRLKAACLIAMTAFGLPEVAVAEATTQVKTQPGHYRQLLGQYEITALSDGTNAMPMDKLLTRTDPNTIRQLLAEKSLPPTVETSINAFLINTGKNLVLIDTGNGTQANSNVGKVQKNLLAAGYRPEQVDTILMTHLHGDHFGGLVQNGKLSYPNATVYVSQKEYDFWLDPQHLAQAAPERKPAFQRVQDVFKILAAANKVKTFTGDAALLPGITPVFAPGHTPGHTAYSIVSDGQKLLAWGDIVHAEAVQMPIPETTISFDSDGDQATKTREALFAQAASEGYLVAGAHLPFPGIGHVNTRVERNGTTNGYRWIPVNYSMNGLK